MKNSIFWILGVCFVLGLASLQVSCGGGEIVEPLFCESDFDCPDGQICSVNNNCVDPF